jgi:hypothetical protein
VYPDDIQVLLKINNYILAIGLYGSEFFYDAANATASPLARYEGANFPFGTQFPNSTAYNKDTATLLANRGDGGEPIVVSIDGMNFKQVPAEQVIKFLGANLSSGSIGQQGIRGCYIRENGDLLYYLHFHGESFVASQTYPTIVYSFSSSKWVRWTHNATNSMPIMSANQGTSAFPFTLVAGHFNNSGVYWGVMTPEFGSDTSNDGVVNAPIYQEVLIPPQNFGTLNRKTMSRLGLIYDRYTDTYTLGVAYSDDGMRTFSTVRNIVGFNQTADGGFPFLTQLGSFRSRGFKIYTTDAASTRMLWIAIEVDINKGTQ